MAVVVVVTILFVKRTVLAHRHFCVHVVLDTGDRVSCRPGLLERREGLATEAGHGVGRPPGRREGFERLAARGEVGLGTFEVDVGFVSETAIHHCQTQPGGVRDQRQRWDVFVSVARDELLDAVGGADASGVTWCSGTAYAT